MFKDLDTIYEPRNLFIWFLLAFQGGVLNVGGYLSVHRFVSHVTGFATLAGVYGAQQHLLEMFGMLLVPLFFLLGTMISAWFVERQRIRGKSPKYGVVFSIIIINLIFIGLYGSAGFFGEFGEPINFGRDIFLLFLLSFTCGLQNAVISSASGAVIRTTHLTGPMTDIGIGLIRIWTTRKNIQKPDLFATWCRLGIFVSFFLGSLAGAFVFLQLKFYGFFLPVLLSLFVAVRLRVIKKM
jgi:uncharacterized membrane protein YoaK (UPF0700 family)